MLCTMATISLLAPPPAAGKQIITDHTHAGLSMWFYNHSNNFVLFFLLSVSWRSSALGCGYISSQIEQAQHLTCCSRLLAGQCQGHCSVARSQSHQHRQLPPECQACPNGTTHPGQYMGLNVCVREIVMPPPRWVLEVLLFSGCLSVHPSICPRSC